MWVVSAAFLPWFRSGPRGFSHGRAGYKQLPDRQSKTCIGRVPRALGACLWSVNKNLVCFIEEASFVFDSLGFVNILIKIMAVAPSFASLLTTGSSATFGRSSARTCVASPTSTSTSVWSTRLSLWFSVTTLDLWVVQRFGWSFAIAASYCRT